LTTLTLGHTREGPARQERKDSALKFGIMGEEIIPAYN
jgi:hypothetical protein